MQELLQPEYLKNFDFPCSKKTDKSQGKKPSSAAAFLYKFNSSFVKCVPIEKILNLKPFNLQSHSGFLKDDVIALKTNCHTELYNFLIQKIFGDSRVAYSVIYIKKSVYGIILIASLFNRNEKEEVDLLIRTKDEESFRIWGVDYISMFYQWMESDKLVKTQSNFSSK